MTQSSENDQPQWNVQWGIEDASPGARPRGAPNTPHGQKSSSSVDYIAEAWSKLQPHVREAILTLVDASLTQVDKGKRL